MLPPHTTLLVGESFSVPLNAFMIIIFTSVWQIFTGICGTRYWGEPSKAVFIAVIAGILLVFDVVVIVGVFILWVNPTLITSEARLTPFPLLPLLLIFVGSIATLTYAHSAYTYAIKTRDKLKA
jgi:predicted permease